MSVWGGGDVEVLRIGLFKELLMYSLIERSLFFYLFVVYVLIEVYWENLFYRSIRLFICIYCYSKYN